MTVERVEIPDNWMGPFIRYILHGTIPPGMKEKQRFLRCSSWYTLIRGTLYRRGFTTPLLKCLGPDRADYVLKEVHEGSCGHHLGAASLAKKVLRAGIPSAIVTNNGTQFSDRRFQELLSGLRIKQHFTSVEHPQTNGHAEAANKVILKGIKKRLDESKANWPDQLHHVLWAYRTTPHSTTGESPFNLTYGAEAIISVEIGEPTWRAIQFNEGDNQSLLRNNLDEVEEI
ncbi:PREDICTED: uncharacterized protein LOC109337374 [Lupinus angustifolius]|uniref:uncharacterized protein LOC109337374 n=1 Tax=Lupinus angustifolius TaxID=3871 RepID=UPI00092FA276|nr:PREDICTED: uncharacterized protein LOC109337374 [Lupinus angustifolius]